jgi:NAD(P)H-dependent FMN reductase
MSHIVLVSGSHRPTGNTPRIAREVEKELKGRGHSAFLIDLSQTVLPLWDEGLWGVKPLDEKWARLWQPLADQLARADGLVVMSPEYHGVVPSALRNLMLMFGNGALVAHKPALLISVSASVNGAYPIAELRATGAKNNRLLWLPEHLIIRHAGEMFQPSPKPEHAQSDKIVRERLGWCLTLLEDYIGPMQAVRAKGHILNEKFANGM